MLSFYRLEANIGQDTVICKFLNDNLKQIKKYVLKNGFLYAKIKHIVLLFCFFVCYLFGFLVD